jgi:peptide chain release factor 1
MEVLRARCSACAFSSSRRSARKMRRSQVGGGDRSEKIRTYNFPQSRVTDHRIDWTTHDLQGFIDGDIGDLIDALKLADVEEQLGADV